jgi:AcrR family transcriptional regulator
MSPKFQRQTKTIWLEAGLVALKEEGPAGLTLERLTDRTGKTRGSFYHHFQGHEAFVLELMRWWRKVYTEDIIAQVQAEQDAHRVQQLQDLTLHLDHDVEVAVRRLAQSHTSAALILEGVDQLRLSYLVGLYQASHRATPEQARALAHLEYAAFVGAQMIWGRRSAEVFDSLNLDFAQLMKHLLRQPPQP